MDARYFGIDARVRSRKTQRRWGRTSGLSLVEVLVSLVIVAMLMIATGVAFDAALQSYKVNHDLATVSVSARNALYQMTYTIRSAWNLDPAVDPDYAIAVTDTSCSMRDAGDRPIIYQYDEASHELRVNVNGTPQWYVMVENVYPVTVGEAIFTETPGFDGNVGRVEIRFMVSQEGVSRTVSAGAVPRNVLYGL